MNPFILLKLLKWYMWDIGNLEHLSQKKLESLKDKLFIDTVRRAYSVPLYQKLFKKSGVNREDIKGIEDVDKLPIISKDDLKQFTHEDFIPNSKRNKLIPVSTSGTTGKSLSIYVDFSDIIIGLLGYLRTIKIYGLKWWKHRLSVIGDFAPHTAETGYIKRGVFNNPLISHVFKRVQWLDTNSKPEVVIKELDRFKPDFIGGYVGMLGHLAVLKKQGEGKNISPRYIASTGAVLDPELKKFIEEAFDTKVFEVYGATETGPIAFQCEKGVYHVMSDLLHVEVLEDGEPVDSKKPGHIVVTKLYGSGTPIIRYNALNDIVAPLYEEHDCKLSGDLLYRIYGRDSIRLYRRDGKIILGSVIARVFSRILYELQTSMIRDVKIIQKSFDEIDILLVIDENLRDIGPSVEDVYSLLEKGLKEIFGSNT
ncbi:MAG: hypothetical protein DRN12_05720, partial [Thermoplasmata archaeon]